MEGLPETAKPTLKLQLSSPIEEHEVSLGGEKATFEGVETSVATLSVDAKDADIPLGAATDLIEIAPLCTMDDPKQPKNEYVTEVPVEIKTAAPATDSTDTNESEEGKAESEGETKADPAICSVTLKVTFKPSGKDQREALYDLLNKTSQKKAIALGELRKRSIEKARAEAESGKSTAITRPKPSVKPGFLNKGGKKEEEDDKTFVSAVKKLYKRVTGPDSIVMKTAFWAVVTKDFWIFFGAVGLMHYRGNVLSLPPPV